MSENLDRKMKFPIVCVGGSAGGRDAYIRLLENLPADMGVAIVIVNHITKVPTHAQKHGTAIQPDMPESAIASGCIDFVLLPENISQEILRIARDEAEATRHATR